DEIRHADEVIQDRIERNRQMSKLMAEAQAFERAEDFDTAGTKIDELLALDPSHAAALQLKMRLDQTRQRRERAEELYQRATLKFSSNDFPGCLALLEEVLGVRSDHP